MVEIQTARLRLIALTLAQLKKYILAPHDLERELGFAVTPVDSSSAVFRAINVKISRMSVSPEKEHPWYTYWLMTPRQAPYGAGQIGFKGVPNSHGEVEIGYGIEEAYRGKGYTTEAAAALVAWAFQSDRCLVVTAETRKDNFASQRVLQKVGMHHYGEMDDMLLWRIVKPSSAEG